jgi:hypothetical protein
MEAHNCRASDLLYVLNMRKYAIMQPGLYKNSFNVNKTHLNLNNLSILLCFLQIRPSAPLLSIGHNLLIFLINLRLSSKTFLASFLVKPLKRFNSKRSHSAGS